MEADDYMSELTEYAGFTFFVMSSVTQTKQAFSTQKDFALTKPALKLEVRMMFVCLFVCVCVCDCVCVYVLCVCVLLYLHAFVSVYVYMRLIMSSVTHTKHEFISVQKDSLTKSTPKLEVMMKL